MTQILPGPSTGPAPRESNPEYLTDFNKEDLNTNAKGGHMDEETQEQSGPRRAECAVQ